MSILSGQGILSSCFVALLTLRKHAYSKILKILQPKKENFQIQNSDIFNVFFSSKDRLSVLVRTASARRF